MHITRETLCLCVTIYLRVEFRCKMYIISRAPHMILITSVKSYMDVKNEHCWTIFFSSRDTPYHDNAQECI